jgi:hypothetical protein
MDIDFEKMMVVAVFGGKIIMAADQTHQLKKIDNHRPPTIKYKNLRFTL